MLYSVHGFCVNAFFAFLNRKARRNSVPAITNTGEKKNRGAIVSWRPSLNICTPVRPEKKTPIIFGTKERSLVLSNEYNIPATRSNTIVARRKGCMSTIVFLFKLHSKLRNYNALKHTFFVLGSQIKIAPLRMRCVFVFGEQTKELRMPRRQQ